MLVSLPAATLNDSSKSVKKLSASICGSVVVPAAAEKFFLKTPSIKQLIDVVLAHPKSAVNHGTLTRRTLDGQRSDKLSKPLAPQHEQEAIEDTIIAQVGPAGPTPAFLDQKQVVKSIAGHLVSMLDDSAKPLSDFEGKQLPTISIHDYVDRLIRYVDAWAGEKPHLASTGISAALIAVEYLDRLNVGISFGSIHRLYMCAVLVAVKFTEDFTISNRFWAKVGGIDLQDMNKLELAFCTLLEWKLQISREDFESQQCRFAEPVF
jgi:Cyclin